MAEHDPLAAEFAALRTAVLVRPPGVRAAQATIRRRRHRTAVVMTSVVAFAVAAVGAAVAQVRPTRQEAPATQHTGTAQPTGSASELSSLVPGPTTRAPHQPGPPPPPAAGTQTIRQSLPASADPIQTGIAAYSSSQWGPYNGVVWSEDQNRGCPTGTP